MGTRSTVKFVDEKEKVIMSVYQQYDGYLEGVGAQVALTLKKWTVEGVTETHYNEYLKKEVTNTNKANGINDLALLYVMDNKKTAYNMYVGSPEDKEEFNYEVEYDRELGYCVNVYEEGFTVVNDDYETYDKLIFTGTAEEFIALIESKVGELK